MSDRGWLAPFISVLCAVVALRAVADDAAALDRLSPSDLARYDRRRIATKDGKDAPGKAELTTVHGHDLRDDGLYLPASPTRGDLPAIFGLRTPAAGAFEWRIHLMDCVELRIKGTAAVAGQTNDSEDLRVEATFASGGRPGDFDEFELREGKATATITFDRAGGVVKKARVEIAYVRERLDPKKNEKPANVSETWTFDLAGTSRLGYARFPVDVNEAIDKGVAHLKTSQKPEGGFEPERGWDLGTTALCVYTLTSCGVPVADPGVEKALALICAAVPAKTYEQAVGLMALERAYTPPEELALGRVPDGKKPVRDMPAERRAWCERTAAALEAGCSSPGTWGYPNGKLAVVHADASNTQYAVLGLQAASRLGIAVKEQTWTGVVRAFSGFRESDGPRATVSLLRAGHAITEAAPAASVAKAAGFRYHTGERRAWGSMTCAGIASLAVARDELRRMKSGKLAKMDAEIDEMILGGWAWLDLRWAVDRHPDHPHGDWHYYFLYALERAAVLDDVQRVGGKDWYFEGATELLARQEKNGAWNEKEEPHTTETCFALLFLKRATASLTPK